MRQSVLAQQDNDLLRRDRERQALPLAKGLRLALEGQRDDRPVAGSAEVDLTGLAEEDEPLDGGREAVRVGGTFGSDRQRFGADREGHGSPLGKRVALAVADEPAERRPDHDLTLRVGPLDLSLEQVCRPEQPGDERVGRAAVHRVRCARLDDPPQIHHRHAVRQRQGLAGVVCQDQGRQLGLGVDPPELVAELIAQPSLEPARRLVEDQELGPRRRARASATR